MVRRAPVRHSRTRPARGEGTRLRTVSCVWLRKCSRRPSRSIIDASASDCTSGPHFRPMTGGAIHRGIISLQILHLLNLFIDASSHDDHLACRALGSFLVNFPVVFDVTVLATHIQSVAVADVHDSE